MDKIVSNERIHTSISVNSVPRIVGFYRLDNFRFVQHKKPNLWHRFFMRVLLNLHWEDAE